jgi:plastocyanin
MKRILIGVVACLAAASAVPAATVVEIRDFAFVPATVVIMKGENVKWTNVGQVVHTSTSDTGKWDSGDLTHGKSFEFAFTAAGTFAYHCEYHPTMKGTVRVTETAVAPTSFGRVKALLR